jgi:hexosaminidase
MDFILPLLIFIKLYQTFKIYMERVTSLLLTFLFGTLTVFTQTLPPAFDARNLQLKWELVANNYHGQPQFLSALTLTNNGETNFPASGWALYFNYIREIPAASVTGHVKMEHVNGDIFRLAPTNGFGELKPKQSVRVEFVSQDPALNVSDAPAGWYIVWDAVPETGYTLANYTINPIIDSTLGYITPAKLFDQYKTTREIADESLPKIFPTPLEYKEGPGEFVIGRQVRIVTDTSFLAEANYLADELKPLLGKKPFISSTKTGKKMILLQKASGPVESYHLTVTAEAIRIEASTAAGMFYGIQSLKSLLPPLSWSAVHASIRVPAVTVFDSPRFGLRSLMLDVARNFQTKDELMRVLDLMAMYKLNSLHLHFIDDEGWRIEIPSLPELTRVGARRGHTLDSKNFLPASFEGGPDPDHSYGSGYYTRTDFIEILRYANRRHIQVIPEIESPGHSRAAIKAMDARYERFMKEGNQEEAERYLLRDLNDQSKYSGAQLWNDNVICVALPSVYRFLEKVSDELIKLYAEAGAPLSSIHFGGDEVPAGVWEKSPVCQELIRTDPDIQNTDGLWYYYFDKLQAIMKTRGLFLSGWEEAGLRKTLLDGQKQMIPNPGFCYRNFHLHVWNNMIGWGNEDLPYRLANAGYKVVLSCVSNQYFDLAYNKNFDEPGYYWGGFVDIDKPFYFIPFDYYKNSKEDRRGNPISASYFIGKDRLTDYGKSNIVGIQGLLWSENIHGPDKLEYMLLPKLLGMAERAWAGDPDWAVEKDKEKSQLLYTQAWSVFANIVGKRELPRLAYWESGFQYRIPSPGAQVLGGEIYANVQFPGLTIRYSSNGEEPSPKSRLYKEPIKEKGLIKLKVFDARERSGRTTEIENK